MLTDEQIIFLATWGAITRILIHWHLCGCSDSKVGHK